MAHLHLERALEADEDFTAILEDDPNHTGALFGRAAAREWMGRQAEADEDYQRFLELAPDEEGPSPGI